MAYDFKKLSEVELGSPDIIDENTTLLLINNGNVVQIPAEVLLGSNSNTLSSEETQLDVDMITADDLDDNSTLLMVHNGYVAQISPDDILPSSGGSVEPLILRENEDVQNLSATVKEAITAGRNIYILLDNGTLFASPQACVFNQDQTLASIQTAFATFYCSENPDTHIGYLHTDGGGSAQ